MVKDNGLSLRGCGFNSRRGCQQDRGFARFLGFLSLVYSISVVNDGIKNEHLILQGGGTEYHFRLIT